eukprot:GEZU01029173.1.p1 GENE.GEZU01029173.1~~GEZU01029173.1.p1  ORF type:complete len:203 (-),score=61.45 GEZU01029173.1:350-958(-)
MRREGRKFGIATNKSIKYSSDKPYWEGVRNGGAIVHLPQASQIPGTSYGITEASMRNKKKSIDVNSFEIVNPNRTCARVVYSLDKNRRWEVVEHYLKDQDKSHDNNYLRIYITGNKRNDIKHNSSPRLNSDYWMCSGQENSASHGERNEVWIKPSRKFIINHILSQTKKKSKGERKSNEIDRRKRFNIKFLHKNSNVDFAVR